MKSGKAMLEVVQEAVKKQKLQVDLTDELSIPHYAETFVSDLKVGKFV